MNRSCAKMRLLVGLMMFCYAAARQSGTSSMPLVRGLAENANSRSARTMNFRMESDSDDSSQSRQSEQKAELSPRGTLSFQEQYPAPRAKNSKWRFELHFAVDADFVAVIPSPKR